LIPPGFRGKRAAGQTAAPQDDMTNFLGLRALSLGALLVASLAGGAHADKIKHPTAVFSGLDKITGRIISFDAGVGETVQFGALRVTARVCYTRPPTEATNTDAFVEVDEVTLQGEIKRIFNGWMFAASPGLHAVEHPIYDVWLTDCAAPAPMKVAEPAPPPATPAAAATASRPSGAPKPRQNPPPRQPAAPQAAPMPPVQGQPN